MKLRIGTRKSQLALWQANFVKQKLIAVHGEVIDDFEVELVEIVSEGDRTLDIPLAQVGGKGLFLKELEMAILANEIDLAVHSMKDVTVSLPDGLEITSVMAREDPRDVFVSNKFDSLGDLPTGSRVGTCSLRRQCQILSLYPQLELTNLRGNVNTRLSKLDEGQFAGIILAAAGLKRLGMEQRITEYLNPSHCLPAVGQGVIGIETRSDDVQTKQLVMPLNDEISSIQVCAERAANQRLGGGCHVPVALYSELNQDELRLRALVGEIDGSKILRSDKTGSIKAPADLGMAVAEDLLAQGAKAILDSVYQNSLTESQDNNAR